MGARYNLSNVIESKVLPGNIESEQSRMQTQTSNEDEIIGDLTIMIDKLNGFYYGRAYYPGYYNNMDF